jgi:hypothetical protein
MRTRTYSKDSSGLFDYHSKDFKLQEFELTEDGVIALYKDDVVLLKNEVLKSELFNLLRCKFQGTTMVSSHTKKQYNCLDGFEEAKIRNRRDYHERFIWKTIHNESGGESLRINDIFRMGRMRFRVREVHDDSGNKTIGSKGMDTHVEYAEHQNSEEIYCRVCMETQNPAKEYANVCECSKRMPIHADCLMDWVKTKMVKKTTDVYEFYTWKGLECDICKKAYPEYFHANGKKYSLLSYEKPAPPFIVFDLFNKDANTLRGCFVIKRPNRPMLRIVTRNLTKGKRSGV